MYSEFTFSILFIKKVLSFKFYYLFYNYFYYYVFPLLLDSVYSKFEVISVISSNLEGKTRLYPFLSIKYPVSLLNFLFLFLHKQQRHISNTKTIITADIDIKNNSILHLAQLAHPPF